jgi:hypothetical protein
MEAERRWLYVWSTYRLTELEVMISRCFGLMLWSINQNEVSHLRFGRGRMNWKGGHTGQHRDVI